MLRLYAFDRSLTLDNDTAAAAFARHTLIVLQGRGNGAILPGQVIIEYDPSLDWHSVCLLHPKTEDLSYRAEFHKTLPQHIAKEVLLFAQAAFDPDQKIINGLYEISTQPIDMTPKNTPFWL